MSETHSAPLLIEPTELEALLGTANILVVDLSKASTYDQMHIPGAVHLDYPQIVGIRKPVHGLLAGEEQLTIALSAIGLRPDTHVIAYDDEGGGKACRLLWTLEAIGHHHYSLLNGGLHAWSREGHPLTAEPTRPAPVDYPLSIDPASTARIGTRYILDNLENSAVVLLDVRSAAEFTGEKRFAAHGGHIPGAINIEWTAFMDEASNLRLKSEAQLRTMLEAAGISQDKTVVVYCQTHHRSAHTWFMLHALGYDVRGYEGSWSDWGNRDDTPIEK